MPVGSLVAQWTSGPLWWIPLGGCHTTGFQMLHLSGHEDLPTRRQWVTSALPRTDQQLGQGDRHFIQVRSHPRRARSPKTGDP